MFAAVVADISLRTFFGRVPGFTTYATVSTQRAVTMPVPDNVAIRAFDFGMRWNLQTRQLLNQLCRLIKTENSRSLDPAADF